MANYIADGVIDLIGQTVLEVSSDTCGFESVFILSSGLNR